MKDAYNEAPSGRLIAAPDPLVMTRRNERANREVNQADLCCPTPLSCLCGTLNPICWLGFCPQTVNVNESMVVMYWGDLHRVISKVSGLIFYVRFFEIKFCLFKPGCYCFNPAGLSVKRVSVKQQVYHLPDVKVADLRGMLDIETIDKTYL
jgi:hypothetical protein